MTETVAIVDYGSGNLRSAEKAFARAEREAGRDARIVVTDNPDEIAAADRVVLPGVGAFAACMRGLADRAGLLEALEHAVLTARRPFLGICVGMQLLAERGLEFNETRGLGWLPGETRRLAAKDPSIKIPHMGWNEVEILAPQHPLCAGVEGEGAVFYFVHSYHFVPENDSHLLGVSVHGERFAAMVARDNIAGVQFHPEKSQAAGLRLISNFLAWNPA